MPLVFWHKAGLCAILGSIEKYEVLGVQTDVLGIKVNHLTLESCINEICQAVMKRRFLRIVTANPEMIYAADHNAVLKETINSAQLVTADGVGVVWAANYLGNPVPERVTGIDLVEGLLPYADRGVWRVAMLGARPGIADLAAKRIGLHYPQIIMQTNHGYFQAEEEMSLIAQIKEFNPDLLLVGLGAGKQEIWLKEHPELAYVSIGVGGSFDTLAGLTKRAPQVIRRLKLEWFYRLIKEPQRLKRQMVLPRFMFKVMKQRQDVDKKPK